MTAAIWPARPTCHDGQRVSFEAHWRDPKPDRQPSGIPFRTCSYCGSIHPEDLYHYLTGPNPVRLGGSDWKYGWPHKFYVEGIPNPLVGQTVVIGHKSDYQNGQRTEEELLGAAPVTSHAKWYNEHLLDLGPEAFELLTPLLHEHSGIQFVITEGRLQYRAPYQGYQR